MKTNRMQRRDRNTDLWDNDILRPKNTGKDQLNLPSSNKAKEKSGG
jgi:hypothetical protein